jgi:exodeoxyribonuclease VIII
MAAAGTLVGAFDDIDDDDYHAGPGISRSDLKEILKSPAHYKHRKSTPRETDAMSLGKAWHLLVLQPELFPKKYVLEREDIAALGGRSNADKEKRAAYAAELAVAGRIALDADTWKTIHVMRDNVMRKSKCRWLLQDGIAERSYYWIDKDTGLLCKARADWSKNNRVLVDLKSTKSCGEHSMRNDIWDYGYYLQAPYYLDGASIATGHAFNAFAYVCCENVAPHGVQPYVFDRGPSMNQGRYDFKRALWLYLECQTTDNWPDYPDEIKTIGLHNYRITVSFPVEQ